MATEAANGWQCTICTFINEAEGATVCEMCGGTKPAGKGKGRLRARNPANPPPPLIPSFGDTLHEHDESSARSSGTGRTNKRSRSGRSTKPATVREEEEQEEGQEEDQVERSHTASSTTRTRTRSSRSSARSKHQQDTENHAPLVIDDSDHDQAGGETEGASHLASDDDDDDDDDDEDESGETPLLLGRGWSAHHRDRAKRLKLDRERDKASNGGGKGGGGAATSRRKKRQRPLPAYPGDDLFRDRAYRLEEADDDAAAPTLTLPVAHAGRRPFWRWPPPPAAMVMGGPASSSISPGRRGVVRGQGDEKITANGEGGGRMGSRLPVVGTAATSEDGHGREGGPAMKAERFTAVAGALPPATQEQHKSKRRRSKLSLPSASASASKRPLGRGAEKQQGTKTDGGEGSASPAMADADYADVDHGAAAAASAAPGERKAGGSYRLPGDLGGLDAMNVACACADAEADAAMGVDVDPPSADGGVGVSEAEGGGNDGSGDGGEGGDTEIEISEIEHGGTKNAETRGGGGTDVARIEQRPPDDGDENGSRPAGSEEEEFVEDEDEESEDAASLGEGEGERASLLDASPGKGESAVVGRSDDAEDPSPTVAGGAPARCRMLMDVGDSDSDSSEDGETRDGGTGAKHLGRAFEEAGGHASSSSLPSTAVDNAVAAAAAAPASAGAADSDGGTSATLSPPDHTTPPRRNKQQSGRGKPNAASVCPDNSPAAEAMGLVDTPPRPNGRVAGGTTTPSPASPKSRLQSGQKRTSGRKRVLERLEWHGAGSQPASPPLSASQGSASRGGWSCERCTLINRGRARFCTACQAPKPSTPACTRAATRGSSPPDEDDEDDDGACGGGGGGGGGVGGDGADTPSEDSAKISGSQQPGAGKGGPVGEDGDNVGDASPSQPSTAGKRRRQGRGDDARGELSAKSVSGSIRAESKDERGADETDSETGSGAEENGRGRGRAAAASAKRRAGPLAGKGTGEALKGFVGDTDVFRWDSEESDWEGDEEEEEEEEEEGESDEDYLEDVDLETAEVIGSQIEDVFLRSQGGASQRSVQSVDTTSPSPKRQRRAPRPASKADQVLDLTDTLDYNDYGNGHESFDEDSGRRGDGGSGGGRASESATGAVEDISDDDSDGDFRLPGMIRGGTARRGSSSPPPPRKFRFFSSVREHRDRGTSCVDFSSLEAAPAGGSSSVRSYAARKNARDRKKGGKGGKAQRGGGAGRGKKKSKAAPKATTAAGRGRGKGRGGSSTSRSSAGGGKGSSTGRVPPSWIPAGVPSGGCAAATGKRGGGGGGGGSGGGARGQSRQPFNHYVGNDEMVDDSIGGGGFHWEGVGQTSFGGD